MTTLHLLRRGRLLIVAAALSLVVVVLLGVVAVRVYGPALTRERVEAALGAALDRPVRVKAVQLRPWLGRVAVTGIDVAAGPSWDAGTAATLQRAEASVGISSLWRRELVVSRIRLEGLSADWTAKPGGAPFRIPATIPDRVQIGPLTAVIGDVVLRDASIRYHDPATGRRIDARGLAVTARPAGGGLDVAADVAALRLTQPGLDEMLQPASLTARLRGRTLAVERLHARWQDHEVRIAGAVDAIDTRPVLDLTVRGALPLAPVARLAGSVLTIDGVATIAATVQGPARAPDAAGSVEIPALEAGPISARSVKARLQWKDGVAIAQDLSAQALGGDVQGSGRFVPAEPLRTEATFRLRAVSAEALEALAPRRLGVRGPVTAAGTVAGDLRRPETLRGRVTVESSALVLPAPAARLGPAAVAAELRLANRAITVDSGRAQWVSARLDATGRAALDGALAMRAEASLDLGRLAAAWDVSGVQGHASVTADVGGDVTAPTLKGRVHATQVAARNVGADRVDLQLAFAGRTLRVEHAEAAVGATRVQAAGVAEWTRPGAIDVAAWREVLRVRADVRAPIARLEDLDRWVPEPWRGVGAFTLVAHVEGTPAAWTARGRVAADDVTVRDAKLERIALPFSLGHAGLEILHGRVTAYGLPVTGDAAWRWTGSGSARLDVGPGPLAGLPGLPPDVPVTGTVRGEAQLAIADGVPSGTATFRGERLTVAGVALGAGTARASVRDGTLDATLALTQPRLDVTARGPLTGGQPLALTAVMTNLDAGPLVAAWLPGAVMPVGGRVSGSAEALVPLGAPRETRDASAVLTLTDVAVAGVTLGSGTARLSLRDRRLAADVAFPAIAAAASGRLAPGEPLTARLSVRDLDAAPLLRPHVPAVAAPVTGTATLHAEATMPFWDPRRARVDSAVLSARDVSAAGVRVGRVDSKLSLANGVLRAEAELPDVGVTGTASGRLAAGERLAVRLTARGLDAAPLLARWASADTPPLAVRASGTAELAVPVSRPAAAEGVLRLSSLEATVGGEAWRAQGPVEVRRRNGVIELQRVQMESRLGSLTAGGEIGESGRLALTIDGRAPLAILPALRAEVREADGLLEASLRIGGTTAAPEITGSGSIRDARLGLRDHPETLRDGRARFTVSPRTLRVEDAVATIGGGTVSAGGELALDKGRPGAYRFAVTAREVAYAPIADLQATWNADVEVLGAPARTLVRGEARLVRGSYTRDISLLRMVIQQRASLPPTPGGAQLDLRVALDDNLVVRTRVARLRVGGALAVQGTTGAPAVFGTLEADEGQIIFRRNTFTLTSAAVRFTDPRRIDPFVDVRGVTEIRGYEVTMTITGRSEDLELRFTSSPALAQDDILSLIAFGGTREQVRQGGAGAVAGEVAGFIVSDLFGVSSDRAGLDVLELETAPEGGRTLRVGKQVTTRTLVVYSRELESAGEQRLRIEYQVLGPLRVAGEQDFRGGFGGDVLVRIRFR